MLLTDRRFIRDILKQNIQSLEKLYWYVLSRLLLQIFDKKYQHILLQEITTTPRTENVIFVVDGHSLKVVSIDNEIYFVPLVQWPYGDGKMLWANDLDFDHIGSS